MPKLVTFKSSKTIPWPIKNNMSNLLSKPLRCFLAPGSGKTSISKNKGEKIGTKIGRSVNGTKWGGGGGVNSEGVFVFNL